MNKIKVLALIGESGAGKDTFMQEILKQNEFDFNEIVSCTSRPQREKEVYGVHYYFYDKDEFLAKVRQGDMFEYNSSSPLFLSSRTSFDIGFAIIIAVYLSPFIASINFSMP